MPPSSNLSKPQFPPLSPFTAQVRADPVYTAGVGALAGPTVRAAMDIDSNNSAVVGGKKSHRKKTRRRRRRTKKKKKKKNQEENNFLSIFLNEILYSR